MGKSDKARFGVLFSGNFPLMRAIDGSVLADGSVRLDHVAEALGVDPPAFEVEGERTVADLLRRRLEEPPRVGDEVERWGLRFEIVDLDGRRIDRVLVSRTDTEPAPSPTPPSR